MAFMKDEELRKIVGSVADPINPNEIVVVKVQEGNGIRRYFFYEKKGGFDAKINKLGRKAGKKLVEASPLGALGGVLAIARPTQIHADLEASYADAVVKHAKNPSDLMHVSKPRIRSFGIFDHIGQMSYGLWLGTFGLIPDPWSKFLGYMDSEENQPKVINYHLTGELFRGPRVLFNKHKKEHQSY
jgi:hypothetical protein